MSLQNNFFFVRFWLADYLVHTGAHREPWASPLQQRAFAYLPNLFLPSSPSNVRVAMFFFPPVKRTASDWVGASSCPASLNHGAVLMNASFVRSYSSSKEQAMIAIAKFLELLLQGIVVGDLLEERPEYAWLFGLLEMILIKYCRIFYLIMELKIVFQGRPLNAFFTFNMTARKSFVRWSLVLITLQCITCSACLKRGQ